jgi:hypothetical protein
LFYLLSISIPLSIMPLFTPLNISNSYLVKELNIHNVNNKIIKDAFKDALSFTNPLESLPRE